VTLRRLELTVAAWLTLTAMLWLSDAKPAVFGLGAVIAVIAALVFATMDFVRAVTSIGWPQARVDRTPAADRDERIKRVRLRATAAARTDSRQLHDDLLELVDDKLAVHHDIDRSAAPGEAMQKLTPTLRRLASGPRRRTANPNELRRILTDIEAL
jgi:hypothetical protein